MRRLITYFSWIVIWAVVIVESGGYVFGMKQNTAPTLGIMTLSLIDTVLLYSWSSVRIGFYLPEKILTPLIKITNFIFFTGLTTLAFITISYAISLLMLMISLLLAVPFGTLAYIATYADFPIGTAQTTLGILFFLKIVFAVSLVLGEKRLFEDYRTFLVLLLFSVVMNLLVDFLHAIVPGFLVSITDAIAAIAVSVVALCWLLYMFFSSLWSVITLLLDLFGAASHSARTS